MTSKLLVSSGERLRVVEKEDGGFFLRIFSIAKKDVENRWLGGIVRKEWWSGWGRESEAAGRAEGV